MSAVLEITEKRLSVEARKTYEALIKEHGQRIVLATKIMPFWKDYFGIKDPDYLKRKAKAGALTYNGKNLVYRNQTGAKQGHAPWLIDLFDVAMVMNTPPSSLQS